MVATGNSERARAPSRNSLARCGRSSGSVAIRRGPRPASDRNHGGSAASVRTRARHQSPAPKVFSWERCQMLAPRPSSRASRGQARAARLGRGATRHDRGEQYPHLGFEGFAVLACSIRSPPTPRHPGFLTTERCSRWRPDRAEPGGGLPPAISPCRRCAPSACPDAEGRGRAGATHRGEGGARHRAGCP